VQSVPITTNPMSLNPAHGKMYSIQLYMIHFFQCIATGRWSSPSTPVTPNNKTDRQDITEILLKEKVVDTNGVIRSCKSKQDGQCKKCR
jgi:hypothetical protein